MEEEHSRWRKQNKDYMDNAWCVLESAESVLLWQRDSGREEGDKVREGLKVDSIQPCGFSLCPEGNRKPLGNLEQTQNDLHFIRIILAMSVKNRMKSETPVKKLLT